MVSVDVKHHIYLLYWNHRVSVYHQLHSDDILSTVQHFVTKVNLVVHHHGSERHVRKQNWVAVFTVKVTVRAHNDQNVTLSRSFELLPLLLPNLVTWHIIMNYVCLVRQCVSCINIG